MLGKKQGCVDNGFFTRVLFTRLDSITLNGDEVDQVKNYVCTESKLNFFTLESHIYTRTILFYLGTFGKINLFSGKHEILKYKKSYFFYSVHKYFFEVVICTAQHVVQI